MLLPPDPLLFQDQELARADEADGGGRLNGLLHAAEPKRAEKLMALRALGRSCGAQLWFYSGTSGDHEGAARNGMLS